jgi:hypothetical protein
MAVSVDGFIRGRGPSGRPTSTTGLSRHALDRQALRVADSKRSGEPATTTTADPEAQLIAERIEQASACVLGRRMYDSADTGGARNRATTPRCSS